MMFGGNAMSQKAQSRLLCSAMPSFRFRHKTLIAGSRQPGLMSLLLSRRARARCHIIRKNVISLMMAAEVVALAVRPSLLVWPSAAPVAVPVHATAVSPQKGLPLVRPVTTLLEPSAWAHQNWRMMLLRFPVPSTAFPR